MNVYIKVIARFSCFVLITLPLLIFSRFLKIFGDWAQSDETKLVQNKSHDKKFERNQVSSSTKKITMCCRLYWRAENSFLSDWSLCSRFGRGAGHNLRYPVEVRELSEDRQRPAHLQSSNCLWQLPVRVRLRPARLCPEFRQTIPDAYSTGKERAVLVFLAYISL